MKRNRVRRLIAISVLGEGESKTEAGFFYEHILMPTFLHGAIPDKAGMEAAIEHSGLDFVIVRPPALSDSEATGQIRIIEPHQHAHRITRADLAQFTVDQLTLDTYLGQAVTIANT